MKKKNENETIQCVYFAWVIYCRKGVYYADGRGNDPNLGRHSLGTKDHAEALQLLGTLDLRMAVQVGRADRSLLQVSHSDSLSLEEGRRLYEEHLKRPAVTGGPCETTRKRYRAVFDKLIPFLKTHGILSWQGVTRPVVEAYLAYLQGNEYGEATLYFEATLIKQTLKYLVENKHLPEACRFRLELRKCTETSTYCYTQEQFRAMLDYCRSRPELLWLYQIVLALGFTGFRIGELATLQWTDVDLHAMKIHLVNDPEGTRASGQSRRRTKNRRNRTMPINRELLELLRTMHHQPHGFVFHGPKGGKLDPDAVRCQFVDKVIKALAERFPSMTGEKGFADGRLHSFRHFFCSWAATNGTPERVVKEWLGHRDSDMISRYFHLHDTESLAHMNNLKLADGDRGAVVTDPPAA